MDVGIGLLKRINVKEENNLPIKAKVNGSIVLLSAFIAAFVVIVGLAIKSAYGDERPTARLTVAGPLRVANATTGVSLPEPVPEKKSTETPPACAKEQLIRCLRQAMCVDMKIGEWMEEYGRDKRKAAAWKAICLPLPPLVRPEPLMQLPGG